MMLESYGLEGRADRTTLNILHKICIDVIGRKELECHNLEQCL